MAYDPSFRRQCTGSGISLQAAARRLHWRHLDTEQALAVGCFQPGMLIPYYDLDGEPTPEMFRIRKYQPAEGSPKYFQPKGLTRAYFPPVFDWSLFRKESEHPLFITEGEKKAAKLALEGFAAIGLGGVWNFQAGKKRLALLPELRRIHWSGRTVFLVFDADAETNPDVMAAQVRLTGILEAQGARVRRVHLPGPAKGVDDHLVRHGKNDFLRLVHEASGLTADAEILHTYNQRFVVVCRQEAAYDLEDPELKAYKRRAFEDVFAHQRMTTFTPAGKPKEAPVPRVWWEWPNRRTVERLVMRPGNARLENGSLNLWRGWGTDPRAGNVKPWQILLAGIFGRPELATWFEQWCAYPLQHPGAKLRTAVFIYGGQGVGKTALGRILLTIYGYHGTAIQDDDLYATFNGWLERSLFVLADDLAAEHRNRSRSKLKKLVDTSPHEINHKYLEAYTIENRTNFLFTANTAAAVPLDASGLNRRFCVVAAPLQRFKPPRWYTTTLDRWLHGPGPAAVHQHLLGLDLRGFDPNADAPDTTEKHQAVATTRSSLESWVHEELLEQCSGDLYKARDLCAVYAARTGDRVAPGTMGRVLGGIASVEALEGLQRTVYYALRNGKRYRRLSKAELARAYQQEQEGVAG